MHNVWNIFFFLQKEDGIQLRISQRKFSADGSKEGISFEIFKAHVVKCSESYQRIT